MKKLSLINPEEKSSTKDVYTTEMGNLDKMDRHHRSTPKRLKTDNRELENDLLNKFTQHKQEIATYLRRSQGSNDPST